MNEYQSWGRYPKAFKQKVKQVYWPEEARNLLQHEGVFLPRGAGRSQGDVCLNDQGTLLDVQMLNRFVDWNVLAGTVTCEAGVTLADILKLALPDGWFLPVTPGTKHVTVGGAIANDVHGKNHHWAGTFGCHVPRLGLLRSTGEELICSQEENTELYQATIGGLGLTGVILWADIKLVKVVSPLIDEEVIKMNSIDDFFILAEESDKNFDYTVAWLDCQAQGKKLGRGLFLRGNHSVKPVDLSEWHSWYRAKAQWPLAGPPGLMNKWSVRAFNEVFYRKSMGDKVSRCVHFNKFFYPLDVVNNWNLVYGRSGFLQYQVVIARDRCEAAIKEILTKVAQSGRASFLSTLKYFGDIKSPGLMSFPRPGLVLAIDFINASAETLQLLDTLDEVVWKSGGAVNPSKDGRMSAQAFKSSFSNWELFEEYIDPKISSSFWRRVTGVLK
ncbi:MAG: FAD-linked oxidase [Candidatus Andersenbacteria bacterium RIFCSPHIGHO2_12_FULL_46_9]|nr:MAG: FAD-linked oxidase [Candidatus Andersenbacteria bacterium RIFCSPHIGHO2_02_FULL_46_16]OGY35386.1 MAG: FAD-linked oxidase [Candidatus Andersenbacteria bacterium RIFCSPHIGHO2_12_FULL_46_9]OGY36254.1 MAG: FAD-linked oxidase [Candidatus Andersenbacteria bacterium RIFCSPLOWO2_02_FULL_46_11]OGY40869.1 MAG: FAD-linked oxidase [Candidatus Andersenbacteria bacterium RIFCSPLOWO2_12_FULL_45_8]HBE89907.1 FAD-binding oxidoreductase [Candidatus Andersenbacteria bacterium]